MVRPAGQGQGAGEDGIVMSGAMSGLETVWLLCCVVTLSSSLVGHREDPGEDEGAVWLGRGE